MKTECDWWYNSLWRWLPMLKCESLSTTVLFRTTCTLTRMIIFPLLMLFLKSYTLLDYRLPGRGPLQKAYVTLDFISKFLLSFHKVTVGSWMEQSPGLTIKHTTVCWILFCRDVLGSDHPSFTPSPSSQSSVNRHNGALLHNAPFTRNYGVSNKHVPYSKVTLSSDEEQQWAVKTTQSVTEGQYSFFNFWYGPVRENPSAPMERTH